MDNTCPCGAPAEFAILVRCQDYLDNYWECLCSMCAIVTPAAEIITISEYRDRMAKQQ